MPITATLNLNGIIMPDDWIFPGDAYYPAESGISLVRVQNQINAAGAFDDLTLFIDSDGGVIEEGWRIYDYLGTLNVPIKTICIGIVASMATVLFAKGTIRLLSPHSKHMVHLPKMGIDYGDEYDYEEYKQLLILEKNRAIAVYADSTGRSVEEISTLLSDRKDHYYTATEAVAYGWSTGLYEIAEPSTMATSLSGRKPIMAHLSEGRKGLGLPEHKPTPQKSINMTKLSTRLTAAWNSIKAVMEGADLKNLRVKAADGTEYDVESTGDEMTVGDAIKKADGTDVPDGDIVIDDKTVTVENGSITAIVDLPNEDEGEGATAEGTAPAASADGEETVTISKAEHDRLKALDTRVTALQTSQTKLEARFAAIAKGMTSADPVETTAPETSADKRQKIEPTAAERKAQRLEAQKK